MQSAGNEFLAGAAFAGDQHRRIGRRHLLRDPQHPRHRRVVGDDGVAVFGDGLKDRGDQLRIRRQRNVFLCPGVDRADRGARIVADAAGHDRNVDPLGGQGGAEVGDRQFDVDHDQVGAAAAAQGVQRGIDGIGMGDRCSAFDRDLTGRSDMAIQGSVPFPGRCSAAARIRRYRART